MKKLKFSKVANTKLKKIKEWIDIENPKVYSFSLLSGYSCPMASDCQTYAVTDKKSGKRRVVDGKNAKFRCFSAIQEAQYQGRTKWLHQTWEAKILSREDRARMA